MVLEQAAMDSNADIAAVVPCGDISELKNTEVSDIEKYDVKL